MSLDDSVLSISGVGDAVAQKLTRLGLHTVRDVIYNYPRTYNDYSMVSSISNIKPGVVTIKATIKQVNGRYVRRGMHITEAVASDKSGSVRIIWFNQPYRAKSLDKKLEYYVSGEFGLNGKHLSIANPAVELVKELQLHAGRIVPVYKQTKGLTSSRIRSIVKECLPLIYGLSEEFPESVVNEHNLISHSSAVAAMHFPESMQQLDAAKKRIGFEEVFDLSFAAELNKKQNLAKKSHKIIFNEEAAKEFATKLGFKLTNAQRKAAWQALQDMDSHTPTNRMIEGDVGSGKTAVAVMAAYMAVHNDFQVAVMAPTEVLARQLAKTMQSILHPHNMSSEVVLLIGSQTKANKFKVYSQVRSKQKHIVVGTHALIQADVDFRRLGLVIIDEQHRFGVKQREALLKKAGHMPHVITMTATPIPRSLALTLYGELDISIIDEKPQGRIPVKTEVCSPNSRNQLTSKVRSLLELKQQVFIVCPLISDNDDFPARSAEEVFLEAQKSYKGYTVELLHGKLKAVEKEAIMQRFVTGSTNILVSTTVIEVGVDVPNATVMIVESAERFGLAQLHQLRGRVGRSDLQSYCYLVLTGSAAAPKRLRALQSTNDGFKLAELDLELRGPGAIYGHMQHGELDLRIAKLSDTKLIAAAKSSAKQCIKMNKKLVQYKRLVNRAQKYRSVTNLN